MFWRAIAGTSGDVIDTAYHSRVLLIPERCEIKVSDLCFSCYDKSKCPLWKSSVLLHINQVILLSFQVHDTPGFKWDCEPELAEGLIKSKNSFNLTFLTADLSHTGAANKTANCCIQFMHARFRQVAHVAPLARLNGTLKMEQSHHECYLLHKCFSCYCKLKCKGAKSAANKDQEVEFGAF